MIVHPVTLSPIKAYITSLENALSTISSSQRICWIKIPEQTHLLMHQSRVLKPHSHSLIQRLLCKIVLFNNVTIVTVQLNITTYT